MSTIEAPHITLVNKPPSLESLREAVETCRGAYARSPHYDTARALQTAQNELQSYYKARRSEMAMIDGGGDEDLSDHDVAIQALHEIKQAIETANLPLDTSDKAGKAIGVLMHIRNLAKHALKVG